MPLLPWNLPGADGQPLQLSLELLRALAGPALAIAVLGAIESLLCSVVADGMSGAKHDPDGELIGQGLGNLVVPFFGGIAATGAIARTATALRAGSRSPLASVFHSAFLLAAVLTLAPLLAYLPMASMAALLLVVAWNMSEVKHFAHILRVAPRSDVTVLLTCFGLTVIFDMVVAVSVGVVLAALLFMRRMAEITSAHLFNGRHPRLSASLPDDVLLYEIAGPLFFGAAGKAMSTLQGFVAPKRAVILEMSSVPAMDVTGLVALETSISRLLSRGTRVILVGVRAQPLKVIERSDLKPAPGRLDICDTLDEAAALVAMPTAPTAGSAGSIQD
jgi:sulfate permease, SulP family